LIKTSCTPRPEPALSDFEGRLSGAISESASVARQFGNQQTAAISLSSLRSFSHEAPPSSLR
jgi:hypothetical protein